MSSNIILLKKEAKLLINKINFKSMKVLNIYVKSTLVSLWYTKDSWLDLIAKLNSLTLLQERYSNYQRR